MLRSLRLRHILSFRDAEIVLGSLNVLVGPNGSGKPNLIGIFDLLRQPPRNLQEFARVCGVPLDWIWKGKPVEVERPDVAHVETVLDDQLSQLRETYERIHPMVKGGSIKLTLIEKEVNSAIPASMLSEG